MNSGGWNPWFQCNLHAHRVNSRWLKREQSTRIRIAYRLISMQKSVNLVQNICLKVEEQAVSSTAFGLQLLASQVS